ncbi:hypothetical protein A6J66_014660 [Yersinia enterocolitica]|nr:hypothetical protein A6J66_014660 [Yersinia enterocolitica]
MTNLPGADLNAACSGFVEARSMNGPSNECSQKDDGCNKQGMPWHPLLYLNSCLSYQGHL